MNEPDNLEQYAEQKLKGYLQRELALMNEQLSGRTRDEYLGYANESLALAQKCRRWASILLLLSLALVSCAPLGIGEVIPPVLGSLGLVCGLGVFCMRINVQSLQRSHVLHARVVMAKLGMGGREIADDVLLRAVTSRIPEPVK